MTADLTPTTDAIESSGDPVYDAIHAACFALDAFYADGDAELRHRYVSSIMRGLNPVTTKAIEDQAKLLAERDATIAQLREESVDEKALTAELRKDAADFEALLAEAREQVAQLTVQRDTADDAWHSVWLNGNWRWLTQKMTTPERELAAAAVIRVWDHWNAEDPEYTTSPETIAHLTWWREAINPTAGGDDRG